MTDRTYVIPPAERAVRDARDCLAQLIRERACGSQIRKAKQHLASAQGVEAMVKGWRWV